MPLSMTETRVLGSISATASETSPSTSFCERRQYAFEQKMDKARPISPFRSPFATASSS